MIDIVIIGAGCAGMTAAIYAARAGKKVLIIESQGIGGQIATSPRVENYPGIMSVSGIEFSDSLYSQVESLGVDLELCEVKEIISKADRQFTVLTDDGDFDCKSVIIAVGSKHRRLGIEREEELSGHGVSYCAVCDGAFYKDKPVAVVGGGNSALQSAEYLSSLCSSVTLIHRRDEFRAEKSLSERICNNKKIKLELNSVVKELVGQDELKSIKIDTPNGEEQLEIAGLFVSTGQEPQNQPFKDLIKMDDDFYILASEDTKTNVDGIYAAGDCRRKRVRQLTTAAADGTVSAIQACSYVDSLKN